MRFGDLLCLVVGLTVDVICSVSHTTRPARKGEEDGQDYMFVSEEDFEKLRSSVSLADFLGSQNTL